MSEKREQAEFTPEERQLLLRGLASIQIVFTVGDSKNAGEMQQKIIALMRKVESSVTETPAPKYDRKDA